MTMNVLVGGKDRRVVLAKRLEEIAAQKGTSGITEHAPHSSYEHLHWGRSALYEVSPTTVKRVTYETGLELATRRGFKRFPTSAEVYRLLFAYHEGKLPQGNLRRTAKDILNHQDGIWVGQAIQRHGIILHTYENPMGIEEVQTGNFSKPKEYSSKLHFEVPKHARVKVVSADELWPELCTYLFSRQVSEFPPGYPIPTLNLTSCESSDGNILAPIIYRANQLYQSFDQTAGAWGVKPKKSTGGTP